MTPSNTLPATNVPAVAASNPADQTMSRADFWSIIVTVLVGIGLAILASISADKNWLIWLAVSVGGLGGLVHEIAQSGGKIFFFQRKADGFYVGALGGAVLGAVAGLLAVRGFLIDPNPDPPLNMTQLIYEAFIAGMALKGVTEAAGGQPVPEGSEPVSASEAMAIEASAKAIAKGTPQPPTLADLEKPLGPPPSSLPADL